MVSAVSIAIDRSMLIPPNHRVHTDYVEIHKIRMANRARMAVGDVDRAYQKRLQTGPSSPFPCPRGYWEGETFVIEDGRHEYVAALMLGVEWLLVAWVEAPDAEAAGY